ncbi:hypothetical protein SAMN05428989_0348 [Pseudoxanthomonas sp. GM95]|uniref:hypothetical protein n=1 Tax=Pseudoxanthomonas sp. GM95 TaxID=1881043 RepID=UPI0008BBA254|nr:hypothetical protein [Pseudoxanthomonas sp. GM95]SEK55988.1 hypothetical protein SAMN05428989_0348 [Pseudoxanthomonas sp. GM95]
MIRTFSFDASRLRAVFAPRKPRHPLLRLAVGLLGLGVLCVLVFFGVFVGAAMLAAGMAYRLLRPRQRASAQQRVVEGEYEVVRKPALPLSH